MNDPLKQLKEAFDSTYFHNVQLSKERKNQLKKRIMEKVSLSYEADVVKELLLALNNKTLSGYEILDSLRLDHIGSFENREGELYVYLHHLEKEQLLIGHWLDADGATMKYYSLSTKGIKQLKKLQKMTKSERILCNRWEGEGT